MSVLSVLEKNPVRITSERCPDNSGSLSQIGKNNHKTSNGFEYSLNQEEYLRTFLDDPYVPFDNNAAEQAIRPFCIGKKNWVLIDTIRGAQNSAIAYSIAETAKANKL